MVETQMTQLELEWTTKRTAEKEWENDSLAKGHYKVPKSVKIKMSLKEAIQSDTADNVVPSNDKSLRWINLQKKIA